MVFWLGIIGETYRKKHDLLEACITRFMVKDCPPCLFNYLYMLL